MALYRTISSPSDTVKLHPDTYIRTWKLDPSLLHHQSLAVIRGPDASHTGAVARYRLVRSLQLVSAGVTQQLRLLQDLVG